MVRPGGVAWDVDPLRAETMHDRLVTALAETKGATEVLWTSHLSAVSLLRGNVGAVSRETAEALGLVGVAARACGVVRDARQDFPSGIYRFTLIPVSTWNTGDVFARAYVRYLEVERSGKFLLEQLGTLPAGPTRIPIGPVMPDAVAVSMVEGWRGEICHVAVTDSHGQFERYKIVDPSFHNWIGLALSLRNQEISDFPLCNKSFNLSYCGHDPVTTQQRISHVQDYSRTIAAGAAHDGLAPRQFAAIAGSISRAARVGRIALRRTVCQRMRRRLPQPTRSGLDSGLELDMGRCLFCNECVTACPTGAIRFTSEHRLAARNREDLVVRSGQSFELARPLEPKMLRLFGRSLKLRMVSAGGSNACEADVNVLSTIVFDLGRFGIQVVASPRHADGVVVIGPVSQNMKYALEKTYEATPAPKIVIAIGVCSISGGPFRDHPEVNNGCDGILPVDLYIPGFPPHPMTILDGLLRLLGRLEESPDRTHPRRGKRGKAAVQLRLTCSRL